MSTLVSIVTLVSDKISIFFGQNQHRWHIQQNLTEEKKESVGLVQSGPHHHHVIEN
jgi:hypothetical protein